MKLSRRLDISLYVYISREQKGFYFEKIMKLVSVVFEGDDFNKTWDCTSAPPVLDLIPCDLVCANGPGNRVSSHTKDTKILLDTSLINTQYDKVCIKSKVG